MIFHSKVAVEWCGTWWLIGRFDAFHPKSCGFESHSSRHIGTQDRITHGANCAMAWIPTPSGVPRDQSGDPCDLPLDFFALEKYNVRQKELTTNQCVKWNKTKIIVKITACVPSISFVSFFLPSGSPTTTLLIFCIKMVKCKLKRANECVKWYKVKILVKITAYVCFISFISFLVSVSWLFLLQSLSALFNL